MSKTAFLFPGQGSQHAGMGRDLASTFPEARQTFEEANDALGFDLAELCFNDSRPAEVASLQARLAQVGGGEISITPGVE